MFATCCPKLPQATNKCLLNLPQAAYQPNKVYFKLYLFFLGWVGWSLITRFKAKFVWIDRTCHLELSLASKISLCTHQSNEIEYFQLSTIITFVLKKRNINNIYLNIPCLNTGNWPQVSFTPLFCPVVRNC